MGFWKSRAGQSSVQIIIGLALLIFVSTAAFTLFGTTISSFFDAQSRQVARSLAQEGLEAVRQINSQDFDNLIAGQHGLLKNEGSWSFSGSEDVTSDLYTRSVTITEVDDSTRDLVVTVSWVVGQSRTQDITLQSRLTDYGFVEVWGNWGIPVIVGSVDLGPEAAGTGISLRGDYVYVSAEISSGNKASFFVADVSDSTDPFIVGSHIPGVDLFDVKAHPDSDIVYSVGVGTGEQFRIYDTSDPADPVQILTISLNAVGHSLFLDGSWLYIGAANGLHVFDISDPANPVEVALLDIGTDAFDVYVESDIAYIATPHNTKELILADVSSPSSPSVITSRDLVGDQDGLSISARKSRLYVGTATAPSTKEELFIFDITNPQSPSLINEHDTKGEINDSIPAGPFLFAATDVSNAEFRIYRVSDPLNPVLEGSLNMAQVATGLDFVDNTIYISLRSNDALQIIQPSP